jgi:uncharacterized membrane protein
VVEKEKQAAPDNSTTSLKPNVAGLLCYLGGWVTGIVFLIIERKNKLVRFHAMQSLVTFGILHIIIGIAGNVRGWVIWTGQGWLFYPTWVAASVVFGVFLTITIVLWIFLMHQTYHGRRVKLALFGDLAQRLLFKLDGTKVEGLEERAEPAEAKPQPEPAAPAIAKEVRKPLVRRLEGTRAGRIVSSSAVIAWSAFFLVFFNFFSQYLAFYSRETVDSVSRWHIYPILTQDLSLVLPILNTTLILSIIGHAVAIAFDRYRVRQITIIVLNALGMATVLTFLRVFPFDFSVVPVANLAAILPTVAVVVLIVITIGLGIGALARFIKLMISLSRTT